MNIVINKEFLFKQIICFAIVFSIFFNFSYYYVKAQEYKYEIKQQEIIIKKQKIMRLIENENKKREEQEEQEEQKKIEIEKEQNPVLVLTAYEREIFAKLIYLEARGESYQCKLMIVSIVLNKIFNGTWGDSLHKVIYYKNNFSPARLIKSTKISENEVWTDCFRAVDEICLEGSILPSYVMYFRASYHHRFKGYVGYTDLDNVYFGYFFKDKKD